MTKSTTAQVAGIIHALRLIWNCPHCNQVCRSLVPNGTTWLTIRCGKCRQGVHLENLNDIQRRRLELGPNHADQLVGFGAARRPAKSASRPPRAAARAGLSQTPGIAHGHPIAQPPRAPR